MLRGVKTRKEDGPHGGRIVNENPLQVRELARFTASAADCRTGFASLRCRVAYWVPLHPLTHCHCLSGSMFESRESEGQPWAVNGMQM